MGKSEFRDLLEQMMGQTPSEKHYTSTPHSSLDIENLMWSSLYSQNIQRASTASAGPKGKSNIERFYKKNQQTGTQKQTRRAKVDAMKSNKFQERPKHKLNSDQTNAFNYFKNEKVELPLHFFEEELSEAFRHLALKLHPDQGGSAEKFIELNAHYQSLKPLFKRPST